MARAEKPIVNAPDTLFKVGQGITGLGIVQESYSWKNGFVQYKIDNEYHAERVVKSHVYYALAKTATLESIKRQTEKLLKEDFSSAEYANYLYFFSNSFKNRDQFRRWDTSIVSPLIWARNNLHSALETTGHLKPNGLIFI